MEMCHKNHPFPSFNLTPKRWKGDILNFISVLFILTIAVAALRDGYRKFIHSKMMMTLRRMWRKKDTVLTIPSLKQDFSLQGN